jgi:ribosomal protein L5
LRGNVTVKEKREWDKIRLDKIHEITGFDILVVWEIDYRSNRDEVINQCKKFLYE